LNFLEEARDWKAICLWARGSDKGLNFVRHMLAWAEDQHRAMSFYRGEILYWAVARVSSVRLLDCDVDEVEEGPASGCVRDTRGDSPEGDALAVGCAPMSESIGCAKAQEPLVGLGRGAWVLVGDAATMLSVGLVAPGKSAR
jgi:hypothetical protein